MVGRDLFCSAWRKPHGSMQDGKWSCRDPLASFGKKHSRESHISRSILVKTVASASPVCFGGRHYDNAAPVALNLDHARQPPPSP